MDDSAEVDALLDQIDSAVTTFTADGGYDQDGVYADGAERHPDATAVVPPRTTAVPSATAETAPTPRDRHLQCIVEHGHMGWQTRLGYNVRARVEAGIGRWKQVIGEALRAYKDACRVTEVEVAAYVLNRMWELGRRSTSAASNLETGLGQLRLPS